MVALYAIDRVNAIYYNMCTVEIDR